MDNFSFDSDDLRPSSDRNDVEYLLDRASKLMDVKKWDKAAEELTKALCAAPDRADVHCMRSQCCFYLDRYKDARAAASEAVSLDPSYATPLWMLANIDLAEKRYSSALKEIRQALELDSSEPLYHATLAAVLLNSGKPREALEAVREALALDAEHPYALRVEAMTLIALGRGAEAEGDVLRDLENNPEDSDSWYHRGVQLLTQGHFVEARRHFLESLRLDPENREAQDGLLQSIAATNPLFAPFWRWTVMLYRFSPTMRYGVIIGLWVIVKLLGALAVILPFLAPLISMVLLAYTAFCVYTWLAEPLFKLAVEKGWLK